MKRYVKSAIKNKKAIKASYADIADLTWDEKINYLFEQDYDVHTYEDMKDFAIDNINRDNVYLARHILDAIDSDSADFYHYDMTMGTMETPTGISDDEDIESIIDLYE